jgi:hypothetical protein
MRAYGKAVSLSLVLNWLYEGCGRVRRRFESPAKKVSHLAVLSPQKQKVAQHPKDRSWPSTTEHAPVLRHSLLKVLTFQGRGGCFARLGN